MLRATSELSRRTLIKRGIGAIAGVGVAPSFAQGLPPLEAEVIQVRPETLERVNALFAATPIVDFHTHLGIWQTMGLSNSDPAVGVITPERLGDNIQSYVDAGVNCLYLDVIGDLLRTRIGHPGNKDRDFRGDEAWDDYLRQYAMMQDLLRHYPLKVAASNTDISDISASAEIAVILSAEGAHMLESDPARIHTLAKHGFKRLQPIHYVASTLGDSQTDTPRYGGLSALGRRVFAEASELGMLLDVAHASEAVVIQTAEMIDKPLALSHTMVKFNSRRFGDYRQTRQRWISPEHARRIADTGGVIGTFPIRAPFGVDVLDAFVEALKVMVDTVGIDHVAWSTDLGEPVRPAFLKDYRQLPAICARLLESGFSEQDLAKFMGGNALRVQADAI